MNLMMMMERVVLVLFVFVLPSWNIRLMSVADAQMVQVVSSSETEVTLEWFRRHSNCSYTLRSLNEGWSRQIPYSYQDYVITYRVQFLSPGTRYDFALLMSCVGIFDFVTAVTNPLNVDYVTVAHYGGHIRLMWHSDFRYSYILKCGDFEIPIRDIYSQPYSVISSFLLHRTTYDFTLYTVFDGVRSSGYNFTVTLPFRDLYYYDSWDSSPPPFGNVSDGYQMVTVDFQRDTSMSQIKGAFAVLTVVAVGLTLIIILIFVFLGIYRKKYDHRRSPQYTVGNQPTDHIYVNTSS